MTSILARALARWRNNAVAPSEQKASKAHALIALHSTGRPVWTKRATEVFAREGFAGNPVGYRCVKLIAEAAASVPWLLYDGAREVPSHPLLDLLAKPNPLHGGQGLMEAFYAHLQIAGNAYLEGSTAGQSVHELYVLRPDRMKLLPGPGGWPEAYEYSVDGHTVTFRQDAGSLIPPILHVTQFAPLDDHYGLSPFEAAARAVDIHNACDQWNKALLDNAARPSGALIYQGTDGNSNLTQEQFDRLKAELEGSFQGAGNAGRPMVLDGGLDWKQVSLNPKDMQQAEARNAAARDIALAFGVPPMLLGIPGDNTFANYAEANRSFWRQTVLPLVSRTAQSLTNWLAPAFGASLRIGFDSDAVAALSGEREALWSRLEQASFLSRNEKRAAVGYGPMAGGDDMPENHGDQS